MTYGPVYGFTKLSFLVAIFCMSRMQQAVAVIFATSGYGLPVKHGKLLSDTLAFIYIAGFLKSLFICLFICLFNYCFKHILLNDLITGKLL